MALHEGSAAAPRDDRPRVAFVVGTRAQLIKVAPVLVACDRVGLPTILLLTGQHRETMDDLLAEFGVAAPVRAVIPLEERATIGSLLGWLPRAWAALRRELARLLSDYPGLDVVVHGDTLSTVLGARVARSCGARVVHLESGLSSGRWNDPFPEELARRLVFRWTDLAFCPDEDAARLMNRLGRCEVVDTGGNTVLDAVVLSGAVDAIDDGGGHFVVSLHRFQNLFRDARLRELLEIVRGAAALAPTRFVLHPATRKRLEATGQLEALAGVAGLELLPRLPYGAFLRLAAGAACVLTDGGSNQEELAALGVPTIVMRERTERSDGLGRNAIMEAELPAGVLAFLREQGYRALRQAPSVAAGLGPSARIADVLAARHPATGA